MSKAYNVDIKELLKENHIFKWEVAEVLNIPETSFSRLFRHELSKEQKTKILSAVEKIKVERASEK